MEGASTAYLVDQKSVAHSISFVNKRQIVSITSAQRRDTKVSQRGVDKAGSVGEYEAEKEFG